MPVLDAAALNADPEGMDFLRDVLGTGGTASHPERPFLLEAWTPKPPIVAMEEPAAPAAAPMPGQIEPRFAEALA